MSQKKGKKINGIRVIGNDNGLNKIKKQLNEYFTWWI